ncbi:LysR substrate-binding domain-containing protein [Pollutimonas harenae]|uniref:LysR family transcriptional regulator n=1 Tax=Pollutimonas harenae TaxID=657015 RepID=A0A853GY55_9BURK|nr:LysR substrate-binding domain-containing protein [Pollutimonas harenae]NYT84720.1 LysR family transcriptional regulator [Pollutimonas harenae]TEA72878.1 LysR family transcriptional regulator [Pollutimonas harenae]
MKLAWIEDLLTLVDAGTFSRAAVLRNVTQPAFSRRIQLLEAWLDVELIDRRSQPMRLSAIAERHIPEFRALLHDLSQLRARMQTETHGTARIVLVTQHSLTMTQLPALLKLIAQHPASQLEFNVRSENRDECVTLFMRKQADLLLCMEEHDELLLDWMPDAGRMCLGTETFIPVSARTADNAPMHYPKQGTTLKLLAYPPDSFLGRIMHKHGVGALLTRQHVEVVHESVFLAGIKEMVMAGLGMAWLPEGLVQRELESGSLIVVRNGLKHVKLDLGLYRGAHATYPAAIDRLWSLLHTRPA